MTRAPISTPQTWHDMQVMALGTHRICVRDPQSPAHCLKFERPLHEQPRAGLRQRTRRWLARRFPLPGENRAELHALRDLQQRIGTEALRNRFAAAHEIIDTPWGEALRCDCIVLDDGRPAPSLLALLDDPATTGRTFTQLAAAVDTLEAWLVARQIPLFDLNPGNFVVVPERAGPRLVCVDAKSLAIDKELLPLSRWIAPLRRRKLQRRAQRLRERIRRAGKGREGATLAGAGQSH